MENVLERYYYASMISFVAVIDIAAGLPTIGVFSISHIYPDAESVVGWF